MTDPANLPKSYVRSTNDHIAFWILWGLLLLPVLFLLLMIVGGGFSIIALLPLAQLVIHGMALKWFLDMTKPMSKSLLMLLGGTGVLYFLGLGSCVIMLMTV